mgnify:CR=1 FL=1
MAASFSTNLLAQSQIIAASGPNAIEEYDDSWTIFQDELSQTYFIDFETIALNLREIVITDNEGQIIHKEYVGDFPVNAIYELDYSQFEAGNYQIELRSYTKSLIQELEVE